MDYIHLVPVGGYLVFPSAVAHTINEMASDEARRFARV